MRLIIYFLWASSFFLMRPSINRLKPCATNEAHHFFDEVSSLLRVVTNELIILWGFVFFSVLLRMDLIIRVMTISKIMMILTRDYLFSCEKLMMLIIFLMSLIIVLVWSFINKTEPWRRYYWGAHHYFDHRFFSLTDDGPHHKNDDHH